VPDVFPDRHNRNGPPADDAGNIAFMNFFSAHTERYTAKDGKWITKVDVSWKEAYHSQDQFLFFKPEGICCPSGRLNKAMSVREKYRVRLDLRA
jgi:hypothetical protein